MSFAETPNVEVTRDSEDVVRQLRHPQEPFTAAAIAAAAGDVGATPSPMPTPTAQELATEYLRFVAPDYGFDDALLADVDVDAGAAGLAPTADGPRLHLASEKKLMDTTVVSFAETLNGIEIWEAGASVVVLENPRRVTSSKSSVHFDINLAPYDLEGPYGPANLDIATVATLLGQQPTKITRTRPLIYRYDPEKRFDPESGRRDDQALHEGPPTLPLPPVPDDIQAGTHYVVTEVLFSLPLPDWGELNWGAFVETRTGSILYLRAFIAGATGMVFPTDPITASGDETFTPNAPDGTFDPLRVSVTLAGLTTSDPQALDGEFVRLIDNAPPTNAPPTSPAPGTFNFSVLSDNFSAVNAYHHCDALFRLVQGLGFDISNYFDGTTFPVPVDHRGFSDDINARAPGNETRTGSGGFHFGRASSTRPLGIACDWRVVLHEFGHALLWDNVHSPNFGFAHSAGDSLAAIINDPDSKIWTKPTPNPNQPRRFITFPWVNLGRRHDRDVEEGWAWGGEFDVGSYESEQILATSHFRIYRATGGDSPDLEMRRQAARYMVYLIIRAIGSLGSATITPTPTPDVWVTALIDADVGTSNFEGQPGGAYHKVIRWGFEKQGLFQPPGTPTPVVTEGAPPDIDVYIDDGRDGEYAFMDDFSNTTDIWNRRADDAGLDHQDAVVGTTNFAYVRVKNRGTQQATNVVVSGFQGSPATDLVWPADWQQLMTAQVAAVGDIPPGGEVIVGPFQWTPEVVGEASLLMAVSADGDRSNIDPATLFPSATGPTRLERLIPFDNNLAMRTLTTVTSE